MHNEDLSSSNLINKNEFNILDRFTPKKNPKFGRGHIVRQYMSGVGVITERYESDEHLLFFQSVYDSDGSQSDIKSNCTSITEEEEEKEEVEEEELNTIMPVNCPCYDLYYRKQNSLYNRFKRLFQ